MCATNYSYNMTEVMYDFVKKKNSNSDKIACGQTVVTKACVRSLGSGGTRGVPAL